MGIAGAGGKKGKRKGYSLEERTTVLLMDLFSASVMVLSGVILII